MDKLEELLRSFLEDLRAILGEVKQEARKEQTENLKPFFDEIRGALFGGRLSQGQVEGITAKITAMKTADFPVSWMAYLLATSYHETARRMLPVREGLSASDTWRKNNLRYYPWYGRGDVQLTWESNYRKADKELGLNGALVKDPDLALDKDISAKIIVRGMKEGWFSGDSKGRHDLARHLPDEIATREQFKQARRIINLMDKADMIAGVALKFQEALRKVY